MKNINKGLGFIAVAVVAVAIVGFAKDVLMSVIVAIIGFWIVADMD